jgi:glutamate-1-semialdehyde aminotransferase
MQEREHDACQAAADAVLRRIEREKDTMYPRLFALADRLRQGLARVIRAAGYHCIDQGVGPFFQIFFGDTEQDRLYNYRDTMAYVREDIYSAWHEEMQTRGVYFHPGQFERWFLSTEHTERDIDLTIAAAEESIGAVARRIPPAMGTRPHPGAPTGRRRGHARVRSPARYHCIDLKELLEGGTSC